MLQCRSADARRIAKRPILLFAQHQPLLIKAIKNRHDRCVGKRSAESSRYIVHGSTAAVPEHFQNFALAAAKAADGRVASRIIDSAQIVSWVWLVD